MADRPNDRVDRPDAPTPSDAAAPPAAAAAAPEEPKIFVVIDGRRFPRPGLETYFADATGSAGKQAKEGPVCSCHPVVGTYCACNKVCRCVPVCGAVGYKACSCVGNLCSCVGHRSSGGGFVGGGCRCAPVH